LTSARLTAPKPSRAGRSQVPAMARHWKPATLSVLIVDDVRQFREMYSGYLSYAGLGVSTAIDGQEALHVARLCPPDVVVLDLSMPGMNGWQFLKELRADPVLRHTPVIVVTAYHDSESRRNAEAAGATSCLSKPCLPAALLEEVQRVAPRGTVAAS
jgi:two-component system cell cycle response regulator DivK